MFALKRSLKSVNSLESLGTPQNRAFAKRGARAPAEKINLGMPCASSKALHASRVDHCMGNPFFKASNAEEEQ